MELGSELVELRKVIDRLELLFSDAAAAFAATDEFELDGAATPVEWIRHNCKMSGHAAAERVCVGEQMERLGQSVEATEDGRIGFAHLAYMARTSRAVSDSASGQQFDETALLGQALRSSVGRFRQLCMHARHVQDPDGYAAEEKLAVEYRELYLAPCDDGVMLSGMLDAAGGAVLRTALEPLARLQGADDNRLKPRRMADGLVELASHALDTGVVPQTASQRTHLQVTVPLETMLAMREAPAAEMEYSLPVSARIAKRLACDCNIIRIALDAESAVVDVGRSRRVVSGATRRALNIRDKCCQWPGCDRPASWTEAHHLVHWIDGGPTNLKNLVLLCNRHHWMVHEGCWQIMRTADGILTIPPATNRFTRSPRAPDRIVAA